MNTTEHTTRIFKCNFISIFFNSIIDFWGILLLIYGTIFIDFVIDIIKMTGTCSELLKETVTYIVVWTAWFLCGCISWTIINSFILKIEVSNEGIKVNKLTKRFDSHRLIRWTEIKEVKRTAYIFPNWIRLYTKKTLQKRFPISLLYAVLEYTIFLNPSITEVPLFLERKNEFIKAVIELAPQENPLRKYLCKS